MKYNFNAIKILIKKRDFMNSYLVIFYEIEDSICCFHISKNIYAHSKCDFKTEQYKKLKENA